MASPHPTKARFADLPAARGHYESWYLEASRAAERLGVWIRYTVHKRPGEPPRGALWFTLFDGSAGRPRAVKSTRPSPVDGGAGWLELGEARIGDGFALGAATGDGGDAAWELRFEPLGPPLFHLPRPALYRTALPRTKPLSVAPAARFDGRIVLDGRELLLAGWRGAVGHNWGASHAERWVWMHGLGFDGASDATWIDVALARVKLGPLTSPWLGGGALSLDGVRHRLGGAGRRPRVDPAPGRCTFALAGSELAVLGEALAPLDATVGWRYADPDGGGRDALHCGIADMTLTVERRGFPPRVLRLAGGAFYELGLRERDHGVPIEPAPDG